MKKTLLLTCIAFIVVVKAKSQTLLNEVYTDPSSGKHEFFELYNSNIFAAPESVDNYTLITYFDIGSQEGFYVMDLPNLSIAPKGFLVGSSALPFNYQGVTNTSASSFNWNSTSLSGNNGYIKKWVKKTANLTDGNLFYDLDPLPSDFNDFFYRRTAMGASYSIFLYKNGVLVNALIFGTGGFTAVLPSIIAMPQLYIDMTSSSTDFFINWNTYATVRIESVSQDAGSDNGFIRTADGMCGGWTKSSAGVQHTPLQSNGNVTFDDGVISLSAVVQKGTAITGSKVIYDVIAAPAESFPVQLEVYKDIGATNFFLDGGDSFVEMNTEYVVTDGAFTTTFFPYDINMLVVVRSSLGCIDKVVSLVTTGVLPVKFLTFQGNHNNNRTKLQWTVANNEGIDRFEVERSTNGKDFTLAAIVFASETAGNEVYDFFENTTNTGKLFYRIKVVETSKKSEYSKTLLFSTGNTNKTFSIVNNPATDKLTINFTSSTENSSNVQLFDLTGKTVMSQRINISQGTNVISLPLSASLRSGTYIAQLNTGIEKYSSKFVKL